MLGGGEQYFTPANATNEWGRTDGRNLLDEAKDQGYTVIRTRDELNEFLHLATPEAVRRFRQRQILFLLAPAGKPAPTVAGRNDPHRHFVTEQKLNGYFLVVEHDLVARAAGHNFGKLAVNEVCRGRRGDPNRR